MVSDPDYDINYLIEQMQGLCRSAVQTIDHMIKNNHLAKTIPVSQANSNLIKLHETAEILKTDRSVLQLTEFEENISNIRSADAYFLLREPSGRWATAVGGAINSTLEIADLILAKLTKENHERREAAEIMLAVPGQQSAPAQFEFVDGVLSVRHQSVHPLEPSTTAAQEALLELGQSLIDDLKTTDNFDRRLLSSLESLQHRLAIPQDIIGVAINNLVLGQIIQAMDDQLSDTIKGQLRGFWMGINAYVAQFEDWQTFSDNAAALDFEATEIEKLRDVGNELLVQLSVDDPRVKPEVRESFAPVLEGLNADGRWRRRAGLAAYRIFQNLVSAVGKGCIGGVEDGTKFVVKWGLVAVVANVALSISPIAQRLGQSDWLTAVGNFLLNMIASESE